MKVSLLNQAMKELLLIVGLIMFSGISSKGQSLIGTSRLESLEKLVKGVAHFSIDSNGELAVVGKYQQSEKNNGKSMPQVGCVYIYNKNKQGEWVEMQAIKSPSGQAYDNFGVSVALSDKYLVIGALGEDQYDENGQLINDTGAAYFYEKTEDGQFEMIQKVTCSDLKPYSIFGSKVDIKNENIVINSQTEENNNSNWIANSFVKNGGTWSLADKTATSIYSYDPLNTLIK